MLVDLKLAIEGTIIMSPDLRDAMDSMYDARVPKMWKNISWESSTLGFWFTEFLERNAQFRKWCLYVSETFDLLKYSAQFIPQFSEGQTKSVLDGWILQSARLPDGYETRSNSSSQWMGTRLGHPSKRHHSAQ